MNILDTFTEKKTVIWCDSVRKRKSATQKCVHFIIRKSHSITQLGRREYYKASSAVTTARAPSIASISSQLHAQPGS